MNKKIAFEIIYRSNVATIGPRLGLLSCQGRMTLETPNLFGLMSRGVIPHITPDVLASEINLVGVHIALEDFLEKACIPSVMSHPDMSLHNFSAIPKKIITLLTPRRTPAVSVPYGNSNSGISVHSSYGFQQVSNEDYIHYIRELQPDIAVALADVPHGSKPGTKRLAKMTNRTKSWVGEMLNADTENQAIFVPVLPINAVEQAEYLDYISDEAADSFSGIAFYDSNLLLKISTLSKLSQVVRLSLDEPSSPLRILEQISLGIDLFTVPFVGLTTEEGVALTFQFPRPLTKEDLTNEISLFPLGIDMRSLDHSSSLDPLVKSCSCYCCKFHHRAYLQHLLSANEMLGWVLLQIHNYNMIINFFASIRKSISEGRFESDLLEFSKSYSHEWPENIRQGPGAGGNHFISESLNKARKNYTA